MSGDRHRAGDQDRTWQGSRHPEESSSPPQQNGRRQEDERQLERGREGEPRDDRDRAGAAAAGEKGGDDEAFFGDKVVDGVPRADKRATWRAEIYVPREGGGPGAGSRDRGGVCIRGPNRFNEDEAESDLTEFRRAAQEFKGKNAAKGVRTLSSQLKTDFERKKHLDSGHASGHAK